MTAEKKPKPPVSDVTVRTVGNRATLAAAKAAKKASKGKAWDSLKAKDKDDILHHLARAAGLVD
jgi:hypothetical protein